MVDVLPNGVTKSVFLRESRQFCGAVVNKEKERHRLRVETGKMGPSSRSAAESV